MYIKFSPNDYVIRYTNGKIVKEGRGLSFFFLERNTSVVAIPISTSDTDFIFEEITKDFQQIIVQGQITYKISDYKKISNALDFTVNLKNKTHLNKPIEKLSKRIINIAEVLIKNSVGTTLLTDAIQSSQDIAGIVFDGLKNNNELTELGITITGFSILKIAANAETARALEAKTREEILKQADDALYERRNASIEQERKVKENQLNTELSIEQKNKVIKESQIATRRMSLEKENELAKMKIESDNELSKMKVESDNRISRMKVESDNELKNIQIENEVKLEEKRKELAELRLENSKKETQAEAYRVSSIMEAYTKLSPEVLVALATMNMDPEKLIAQAFQQLAGNADKIGQLNITPDLLESVINKGSKK